MIFRKSTILPRKMSNKERLLTKRSYFEKLCLSMPKWLQEVKRKYDSLLVIAEIILKYISLAIKYYVFEILEALPRKI